MTPTTWKLATTKAALANIACPLGWRKPRHVATDDLFDVLSNEQIAAAFGVMAASPAHTFETTTVNGKRLAEWFAWAAKRGSDDEWIVENLLDCLMQVAPDRAADRLPTPVLVTGWPLKNVRIGVRISDQASADEQIRYLLDAPAAFRMVVCDPLVGPVDLRRIRLSEDAILALSGVRPVDRSRLNSARPWVLDALADSARTRSGEVVGNGAVLSAHAAYWCGGVSLVRVGGETGENARACDLAWVRSLVSQCGDAGVAVEVTRLGSKAVQHEMCANLGANVDMWPADLRKHHKATT